MSGIDGGPDPARSRRWSSLSWRLAILIIALLAVSALITTVFAASTVRSNERIRNDESMRNVHRSVAQTIDEASAGIARFETDALTERKQQLRDLTNAQLGAMDSLDAEVEAGRISLATAQEVAARMLFDYRYGSGDYFFAFTPDMVSIVEPNPTFRGNMIDYRDPNGKAFFREFQQVALGPGAGYVDYVGTRVGASVPAPKISYVALFAPWQWVVGTGVYLDDIAARAADRLATARAELSDSLQGVRFAGEGFFFVLDQDGGVVAGPDGQGLDRWAGSRAGRRLERRLIADAPRNGGIRTEFASADLGGSRGRWQFGVSTVGSERWVLVSAVPKAELERTANRLAWRQVLLSLLVLVIGLAIGLLSSRRIVRPVRDLTGAARALEAGTFDPASLDDAADRRDEVGSLARAFRRMAAEVVERERALRDRVKRLEVVIDHRKVDEEINAIIETDFFRRLEARADELRTDGADGGGSDGPGGAADPV